jgi:N-acetylglucosamine kinase-like BadF-type ATPase
MPGFFLGVDGGQSSTVALIGDEHGRVLGRGRSGPCNHVAEREEGREKLVHAVRECLSEACRDAGIVADTQFTAACLGFSGGPADKERLVGEIVAAYRLIVTDDALIALSGAMAGEPGVITISGTGSIAFGRNAHGERARAGGWGYIFGDEGSSFDITRRALRAALRFEEGWGPATSLHRVLLDTTRSANANELLHRFYTSDFPRRVVAGFSRLVDHAAGAGDAEAIRIISEAAQELLVITKAVSRKLFGRESANVAFLGGAFRSDLLLRQFQALIENEGDRVRAPRFGPAAGALIEAYQSTGLKVQLSNVPEEKT